jgi:hypothetical protein
MLSKKTSDLIKGDIIVVDNTQYEIISFSSTLGRKPKRIITCRSQSAEKRDFIYPYDHSLALYEN